MDEELEASDKNIIRRFRIQHHAIAQMFAAGYTPSKIRRDTGVSQRRLALLYADPTFQELIAYYAKKTVDRMAEDIDIYSSLAIGNMISAEMQLAERLEAAAESGELLPTRELHLITSDRADRFGYSKHTVHEHTHDFASRLARARKRSGHEHEMKTVEAVAQSMVPPVHALPPPREEQTLVTTKAPQVQSVMRVATPAPRSFSGVLIKRRKIA